VFLAPLALAPADSTGGFESTFLQYGVLGAVALILGYFAWDTIKRRQRERDRAALAVVLAESERITADVEQITTELADVSTLLAALVGLGDVAHE
jgi:hypothetical protein